MLRTVDRQAQPRCRADLLGIDPKATTENKLVLVPRPLRDEVSAVREALQALADRANWPAVALVIDMSTARDGGFDLADECVLGSLAVSCSKRGFGSVALYGLSAAQLRKIAQLRLSKSGIQSYQENYVPDVGLAVVDTSGDAATSWRALIEEINQPSQCGSNAPHRRDHTLGGDSCRIPAPQPLEVADLEAMLAQVTLDPDGRRNLSLLHARVTRETLTSFLVLHMNDQLPLTVLISAENQEGSGFIMKRSFGKCSVQVAGSDGS